jgi:hypothetical protein
MNDGEICTIYGGSVWRTKRLAFIMLSLADDNSSSNNRVVEEVLSSARQTNTTGINNNNNGMTVSIDFGPPIW